MFLFSWLIATRTCVFVTASRKRVRTGCRRLSVSDGCSGKPVGAAAREPKARGRSGSRSAAERSAVAQRGKASSRCPTRRTLPTRSARRRGSRLGNRRQGAARRRRGSRAPAWRFRGGGVARAPEPQARARGSRQAQHCPQPNRVQRAGLRLLPARGVPRWKRGTEGVGAPYSRAHCRASSPDKPPPGVQPG